MRTTLRVVLATGVVLAVAALLAPRVGDRRRATPTARAIRVLPPDSVIAGPVLVEHRVGGYLLQIIQDTLQHDRIADIKLNTRRVYAVRAMDIRFDPVGEDLTGDGIPEVVVHQFSGGLHCCTRATVLTLGPTLVEVGSIDGGDGDVEFEDVDGDGIPELKVGDWRFAYWRDYAFADTPAPEILFRYRDGGYEVACDLMRDEPPTPTELAARARELTEGWAAGDPPVDLWGYAVELVYKGHADLAFRWLDESWPPRLRALRAEFIRALREKLRGSPCWSPPARRATT